MKCDKCGTNAELTQIHIRTGKRGRPPIKHYCAECLKSPEVIIPGEKRDKASGVVTLINDLEGFDSAALFLLTMPAHNLFEQVDRMAYTFRCKGCREVLPGRERDEHYKSHKVAIAA